MTKEELEVLLNGMKIEICKKIENFNQKYDFKVSNKKIKLGFSFDSNDMISPLILTEDTKIISDFETVTITGKNFRGCLINDFEEEPEPIVTIMQVHNDKMINFMFYYKENQRKGCLECYQIERKVYFLETLEIDTSIDTIYYSGNEIEKFYKKFPRIGNFLGIVLMKTSKVVELLPIIYEKIQEEDIINDFNEYNETLKLFEQNNIFS